MPFQANVLRVMIASPGDVDLERTIVTQELHGWNDVNASARQLVLLPVKWETHSTPEYGAHPQTIINRQLLENADIVIAIFGTRIGTPTGEHLSGTVEEVKRHVAAGKTAKIYFSDVPISPSAIDSAQYALLQEFKKDCRGDSLYAGYDSLEQFRIDFKRHLELELNQAKYRWLQLPRAGGQADDEPVGVDALRLLRAASSDDGTLMHQETFSENGLRAGKQQFLENTPRSAAKWKAILSDLIERGALEHVDGGVYRMTAFGYDIVDQADAQEKALEPTSVALSFSGPPNAQTLVVKSNHMLRLNQLDFLTTTDACISSQPLTEEGREVAVRLNHAKVIELFNAPRTDRNHSDFSGPAKLRLSFRANDGRRQEQVILAVMLTPRMVDSTQWIAFSGSGTIEIPDRLS
jgi:hypothetical protein